MEALDPPPPRDGSPVLGVEHEKTGEIPYSGQSVADPPAEHIKPSIRTYLQHREQNKFRNIYIGLDEILS
jgi:hypothetical protein